MLPGPSIFRAQRVQVTCFYISLLGDNIYLDFHCQACNNSLMFDGPKTSSSVPNGCHIVSVSKHLEIFGTYRAIFFSLLQNTFHDEIEVVVSSEIILSEASDGIKKIKKLEISRW